MYTVLPLSPQPPSPPTVERLAPVCFTAQRWPPNLTLESTPLQRSPSLPCRRPQALRAQDKVNAPPPPGLPSGTPAPLTAPPHQGDTPPDSKRGCPPKRTADGECPEPPKRTSRSRSHTSQSPPPGDPTVQQSFGPPLPSSVADCIRLPLNWRTE